MECDAALSLKTEGDGSHRRRSQALQLSSARDGRLMIASRWSQGSFEPSGSCSSRVPSMLLTLAQKIEIWARSVFWPHRILLFALEPFKPLSPGRTRCLPKDAGKGLGRRQMAHVISVEDDANEELCHALKSLRRADESAIFGLQTGRRVDDQNGQWRSHS
jgi:hypothetical protein